MNGAGKTLLLVDDELFFRQSSAAFFKDNSWFTLPADSGEQAWDLLEQVSIDASIVDIRMGGMDGNRFIQEVCSRKLTLAFVICTGSLEYKIPVDLMLLSSVPRR
ncbi:MAG: response regulator [Motiliproteus sp.]